LIPAGLRDLLIPGSIGFLLVSLVFGALLLLRRKDGGRAGRLWITGILLLYWVLSTPAAAVALVGLLSPNLPPVMSKADARGAEAIVLLGAGMDVHRSRGDSYGAPTREGSLRALEAVRLHRLLGVPIVATGGLRSSQYSESGLMAHQLEELGVPPDQIIEEGKSANTRDHALLVPPLLKAHGLDRFVLVTSQQHIARALGAFRAVGADPVPSTPEVYVARGGALEMFLPSRAGLYVSERLFYDLIGRAYYKAKGWAANLNLPIQKFTVGVGEAAKS
jgi:uncharacterized SAM-binding protein YcdF (DUF218 family)